MLTRVVAGVSLMVVSVSARPSVPDPRPVGGGQAEIQRKQPQTAEPHITEYGGRVIALTAKSITIDKGAHWEECIPVDANGQAQMDKKTKRWYPAPPPRTFPVSPDLAAGKMLDFRHDSYRPSDVRVGDGVRVWCEPVKGVTTCLVISIMSRPGGRVPESPNARLWPNHPRPHHAVMNAYADRDERGIPLPDWLIPEWDRPTTPVAPPPREVGPTAVPAATP